jgi:hypothetical protein
MRKPVVFPPDRAAGPASFSGIRSFERPECRLLSAVWDTGNTSRVTSKRLLLPMYGHCDGCHLIDHNEISERWELRCSVVLL